MRPPKGYRMTAGHLRIAVNFEEELFVKITRMAAEDKRTFSAVVNELCKLGIFDLEESDALEPAENS